MKILPILLHSLRLILAISIFGIGLYVIIITWVNLGKMLFTSMEYGPIMPLAGAALMTLAAFISGRAAVYRRIPFFFLIDVAGIIAWLYELLHRFFLFLRNLYLQGR
ncbi:MAG: hypothetical protein R3Y56_10125 [Akkermansia sp.]